MWLFEQTLQLTSEKTPPSHHLRELADRNAFHSSFNQLPSSPPVVFPVLIPQSVRLKCPCLASVGRLFTCVCVSVAC